MSDPVKSSEIEDVLSSIRRLVSEEARHEMQARRAEAEPAAAPETPAGREPDALVLTPALRVHDGGRASATEAQRDAGTAAERPASEVAASEAPAAREPGSDAERAELSVAISEVVEAPFEAAEEAAPDTLEAKITALEALIAGASEEADRAAPQTDAERPEGSDPADAPEAEMAEDAAELPETAPPAETSEALPRADVPEAVAPAGAGGLDRAEDAAAHPAAAEQATATPAAAARGHSAEAETQTKAPQTGAPMHDAAFDAFEFTSSARRPVTVTPLAEDAPAAGLLDEDSLRDMVVEIVREELQGALGERITRNVRRLVRREIHRALAAQDLD